MGWGDQVFSALATACSCSCIPGGWGSTRGVGAAVLPTGDRHLGQQQPLTARALLYAERTAVTARAEHTHRGSHQGGTGKSRRGPWPAHPSLRAGGEAGAQQGWRTHSAMHKQCALALAATPAEAMQLRSCSSTVQGQATAGHA